MDNFVRHYLCLVFELLDFLILHNLVPKPLPNRLIVSINLGLRDKVPFLPEMESCRFNADLFDFIAVGLNCRWELKLVFSLQRRDLGLPRISFEMLVVQLYNGLIQLVSLVCIKLLVDLFF